MARQEKNLNFTHLTSRWLLTLGICITLSLLAQKTSAQESPQFLTLQESIRIALERNLELIVAQ